ncbi:MULTISPECIES: OmpA family protein [unclassified Variovorax]|nr:MULTISPECIES: OmpA family protein [unclassified Variovorax]VTU41467.1 Outer membrane protein-associated (lipo)proteins [Variovorax sp. SRS16]VTU41495.1 Outer membrane protein-associated (lipo)proteins [Variovorax sp. PBL-E5]
MIEVPAHVQHENVRQNHIDVVGGTNWDLSRSAVETPITPLPDPVPLPPLEPTNGYQAAHAMPVEGATVIVDFAKNSVLISKQTAAELRGLHKKSTVLVAGHAGAGEKNPAKLAQRRAQAVAANLKRRGHRVEAVRSFSSEVPRSHTSEGASLNQRVEVFER